MPSSSYGVHSYRLYHQCRNAQVQKIVVVYTAPLLSHTPLTMLAGFTIDVSPQPRHEMCKPSTLQLFLLQSKCLVQELDFMVRVKPVKQRTKGSCWRPDIMLMPRWATSLITMWPSRPRHLVCTLSQTNDGNTANGAQLSKAQQMHSLWKCSYDKDDTLHPD